MASVAPQVSVIIPTQDRSAYLLDLLAHLRLQSFPLAEIEVLVVADACTDDTLTVARAESAPYPLRVLEVDCRSAAGARNRGAAEASGELLLFLDDDVRPVPSLVEAHVAVHRAGADRVAIGPYLPFSNPRAGYLDARIRDWWETLFRAMAEPGHRFTFRDLVSGNLSLRSDLFTRSGGFDTRFAGCGREDYELGIRLIEAGARFHFVGEALGHHHDTTDLDRFLRRKRHEGRADVLVGRYHPHVRKTLMFVRSAQSSPARSLFAARRMALERPASGDRIAAALRHALPWLEAARLPRVWTWVWRQLSTYWYWRGVRDELGGWPAVLDFVGDASPTARRE